MCVSAKCSLCSGLCGGGLSSFPSIVRWRFLSCRRTDGFIRLLDRVCVYICVKFDICVLAYLFDRVSLTTGLGLVRLSILHPNNTTYLNNIHHTDRLEYRGEHFGVFCGHTTTLYKTMRGMTCRSSVIRLNIYCVTRHFRPRASSHKG